MKIPARAPFTPSFHVPSRLMTLRRSSYVAVRSPEVPREATAGYVGLSSDAGNGLVNVDPERLEQALRNLLENALRHTPPGQAVRITASRSDGTAAFRVEDSGPGFP
jgi:signal transduction histidine kinase